MEWIYLVLIALVIAFGIAVLIASRRRAQRSIEAPSLPPAAPPTAPPRAGPAVLEPEVVGRQRWSPRRPASAIGWPGRDLRSPVRSPAYAAAAASPTRRGTSSKRHSCVPTSGSA